MFLYCSGIDNECREKWLESWVGDANFTDPPVVIKEFSKCQYYHWIVRDTLELSEESRQKYAKVFRLFLHIFRVITNPLPLTPKL